jgi:hypothetical protein
MALWSPYSQSQKSRKKFGKKCYSFGSCVTQTMQGCQMLDFQAPKTDLGKFLEGLEMEKFGTFNCHLEGVNAIGHIL